MVPKDSFELNIRKINNRLQCTLSRSPPFSMGIVTHVSTIQPKSILTSQGAIMKDYAEIVKSERKRLKKIDDKEAITQMGKKIGDVLNPVFENLGLIDLMQEQKTIDLTLTPEPNIAKIPWELAIIDDNGTYLCEKVNLCRRMQVTNKAGFSLLTNKTKNKEYPALVVGLNYKYKKKKREHLNESIKDAKIAYKKINAFAKKTKTNIKMLHPKIEGNAKQDIIQKYLKEGITLFHFSGHGKLKVNDSKISLKGKSLSAKSVEELFTKVNVRAPTFSFLNACETCLQKSYKGKVYDWAYTMANNGGIALIGTLWYITDEDATPFSKSFYNYFLTQGKTFGEAVRLARLKVKKDMKDSSRTWTGFIAYGGPRLKATDLFV